MGPTLVKGGNPQPGHGPAWVIEPYGIAGAGSALPLNPERLHGAGETAYLNLLNLPAMRDTFRQGIIEQRLFLAALRKLRIPPLALASCTGPLLPAGATSYQFDSAKIVAQGQSMGGMYTNLISAVEPKIRAAVPTGAGGFWTYFVLQTHLYPDLPRVLSLLIDSDPALTFLHPTLQLVEMGWESADPFVSMQRLARRPLPGHPVRPIYEPVGEGDQYPLAGDEQPRLSLRAGRGLYRGGRAISGRWNRGSARDLSPARRGQIPDGMLPRQLPAHRPRGGGSAAAARQRLPVIQS